jgi:hypothetical protein
VVYEFILRIGQVGPCYSRSHWHLAGGLYLLSNLSRIPRWSWSDFGKEWLREKTQIQIGGWDANSCPVFSSSVDPSEEWVLFSKNSFWVPVTLTIELLLCRKGSVHREQSWRKCGLVDHYLRSGSEGSSDARVGDCLQGYLFLQLEISWGGRDWERERTREAKMVSWGNCYQWIISEDPGWKIFRHLCPAREELIRTWKCSESDSKVYWRWRKGNTRESSGLWAEGIETPVSLLKVLYKLKGQMVGEIWVVFQDGLGWLTGLIDKVLSHTWGTLLTHLC